MASSTDHGFFGSWVRAPHPPIINFFRFSPWQTWKILSRVYPGNETAWIIDRSARCCCCCCCSHIDSRNQVRDHRTGSSHSGAEEYPREKTQTTQGGTRIPGISHLMQFMLPRPETYESEIGSQSAICKVYTWCIRLITRAWKNRLKRLPPKKDYHVYITRSIYHYACARQTQVKFSFGKKRNKEQMRRERKGKKSWEESEKKKRKRKIKKKKRQEKHEKSVHPADLLSRCFTGGKYYKA